MDSLLGVWTEEEGKEDSRRVSIAILEVVVVVGMHHLPLMIS